MFLNIYQKIKYDSNLVFNMKKHLCFIIAILVLASLFGCQKQPPTANNIVSNEPIVIPEEVAEAEQAQDSRIELVKEFINNENYDNIDEYISSLTKNLELTDGFLNELIKLQIQSYQNSKSFDVQWARLYKKGANLIPEEDKAFAYDILESVVKEREEMSMVSKITDLKIIQNNPTIIQATILEIANHLDNKGRRELVNQYVLTLDETKIADIVSDGQALSSKSIVVYEQEFDKIAKRENKLLDEFKAIVGLRS